MNLSKNEIINFYNGILTTQQLEEKFNEYFTYALSRNKRILQPIVEAIQDVNKIHLEEYNKKLNELTLKYAVTDGDKKPILNKNGGVSLGNNVIDFNNEKKVLDEEYKEALNKNKAFLKEQEDVNVYVYKHKFPDGYGDVFDLLYPMREEPKEKEEKI